MEKNTTKTKSNPVYTVIIAAVLVIVALYALGVTDLLRRNDDRTYESGGMVFHGQLSDGRFTGTGTIVFENGDTYEGALVNGQFEGYGVYTTAEGWRYEGEFRGGHIVRGYQD